MNTTEQPIRCINIAVLHRYMDHNRPVPCDKLNTVVVLLDGPVVETRTHRLLLWFENRPDLVISHSALHNIRYGSVPNGGAHGNRSFQ